MNRLNRDFLTGAFNRDKFFQGLDLDLDLDLDSALHRSKSVAMILADVDEFRKVNDIRRSDLLRHP
jgi:PleD family two-component response regulator